MREFKVTGIISVAGLSERMGSFKPMEEFNGEPFILLIARKMLGVCSKVVVVTGFKKEIIEETLKSFIEKSELETAYNPDYEKGMFVSLKRGIEAAGDFDFVLYHFVDQPFFEDEFYKLFLRQIEESADWIQPSYKGKAGHPVLISRKICDEILGGGYNDLRSVRDSDKFSRKYWECGRSEILLDFDTKRDIEDYKKLRD